MGFEPMNNKSAIRRPPHGTTDEQSTHETGPGTLAECLALLAQNDPDFATVAEAWSELPEPVRAGIVAMVKAVWA